MEGIPVKISEKYKPPRKITLPASVLNKLHGELNHEEYDFKLERFVADKMAKLKEQQKSTDVKNATKLTEAINVDDKTTNAKVEENVSQNNILTPVPLKPLAQSSIAKHQVIGGINISDFENDTSSPFDSVELKTLNDMEELAHVLGGSGLGERWRQNGSTIHSWAWGALPQAPPAIPPRPLVTSRESIPKPIEKVDNETSVILQSLQKHIDERKASLISSQKSMESSSGLSIAAGISSAERVVEKKREILPNPLTSLNGQSQAVARRIAEMGFPISRAARATDMFGPNEGKVIEFMLEVQSLEESGYPGEQAERALVICKYSREDAIKFLDSTNQIMRLGFNEEDVISALIKTGLDRDKALDSLIS